MNALDMTLVNIHQKWDDEHPHTTESKQVYKILTIDINRHKYIHEEMNIISPEGRFDFLQQC